MTSTEIEVRALPDETQRRDLLTHMRTLGSVKRISRVMIDFSGEDRDSTLVLRINNGDRELVTKTGGITDTVRYETRTSIPSDVGLQDSLRDLALQGHTDAMVSRRHMYVTQTKEFEYSLRDVIEPQTGKRASTLFELEACEVIPGSEAETVTKLLRTVGALGLNPLSGNEWQGWISDIYTNFDQPFHYTQANAEALETSLRNTGLL